MVKKIPLLVKVLFVEFLLTVWLYIDGPNCGDICHNYGFLNPFGYVSNVNFICPKVCVGGLPNSYFYLAFDIFVLTLVIFLISIIIKKIKRK